MTVFDFVIFPVIITDSDGFIIYKNQAAKRCIPSPRLGGNLHKQLNTANSSEIPFENVGIRYIENERSIFKRAFVMPSDDKDIWLFLAELQLSEPEDIAQIPMSSLKKLANNISHLFDDPAETAQELYPARYYRMESELLGSMKEINLEKNMGRFKVADILDLLKDSTLKLAASLNFRVNFDFNIRDSQRGYKIKFVPFAVIYTYILLFLLRTSSNNECHIEAVRVYDTVNFTFRTGVDNNKGIRMSGEDFYELASIFPEDQINIMHLKQKATLNGYKIDWSISEDGELAFNLGISLNDSEGMFVFQPVQSALIEREFRYIQKRVIKYIEAVFTVY